MPILIASFNDQTKIAALIAALYAADPQIQVAVANDYLPPPPVQPQFHGESATEEDPALIARAKKYVDAIRPTPLQLSRKKLLQDIYFGYDTLSMSKGEELSSPRGAVSGLARTLAKAFPGCIDQMDELFRREKTYFPDGKYKAIKYRPTVLGSKVLALLHLEGALK